MVPLELARLGHGRAVVHNLASQVELVRPLDEDGLLRQEVLGGLKMEGGWVFSVQ